MKLKVWFLLFIASCTLNSAQLVELAGDKNYPPYSYSENGIAKGVYVDILKEAFNQIEGYDLKLNMMAYERAIELTKTGQIVGFFPPYYGKERTAWTKFSRPILPEQTIVFAKKNILKDKVDFPEDFYGLKACLNRGFNKTLLGGEKFTKAIEDKQIKLIEGDDNHACLARVIRGMADFYINDQLIDTKKFKDIKKGMNVKANFGHVGFTLKTKNYPYIKDFEMKFNQAIKNMKRNGQIDKILEKYKN
jgi:polar amino acid transport system substrate-binding protein